MNNKVENNKVEETISMFIGLGVVVLVVVLIINLVSRAKGNISVPGISIENKMVTIEPTKAPSEIREEYEVRAGDSLWKIAEREMGDGFKWQEVAGLNNLKDPNILLIGQKLKLPENKIPEMPSEYKVVSGDSLWKIATLYYHDGFKWTELWNLNKDVIKSPDKLEIGMVLRLR